jgi:predicted kinase
MGTEGNLIRDGKDQKRIRLIRPSVVVLCGPAACGKSTFAARHFRPTQVVSSDQARALVCDDERDQRFQTEAFALLHYIIEQRLSINRLCVVDSTALTQQARRSLLDLARRHRVPSVALILDVPLATCLERDAKRERTVGAPAIERQHQLFEQAKSAIGQEGFDQIIELREQDLERVEVEIVFRPVSKPAAAPVLPEPRRPAPRSASDARNQQGQARNRRWSGEERGAVVPPRSAPSVIRPTSPPPMPNGAQSPVPTAAPTAQAAASPEPDKASESAPGSQETGGGS